MNVRQSDLVCLYPCCPKVSAGLGLCSLHYQRCKKGDPDAMRYAKRTRRPPGLTHEQAFELGEKRRTETGCIEWMGHRSPYHYGIIQSKIHGGVGAHRVALGIAMGAPVPDGLHVLHTCDNPPCVNPEHLFVGTDKDNVVDMMQKDRHYYGMRVMTRKLDEQQVSEIIARYAAGGVGRPELAREYGVSAATVQKITEGKMWKHLARHVAEPRPHGPGA